MSIPFSSTTLRLPPGFRNLLEGLVMEVLRVQPPDIVVFAAQHFQTLLEQREATSADPVVWGARLEELQSQPFSQEPEKDKDKEKGKEEAGGAAPTAPASLEAVKQLIAAPHEEGR